MRRSRALAATAAAAVAVTMMLTLSPSQGSDAQWRETATAPATGPTSDTFDMTAEDVPFPAPVWSGDGRVSNSPRIDVTNESTRHSSWVNVHGTSVKNAVSPDSNNILSQMALDYEFGDGKCELLLGSYWRARGVGQITENTTYPRSQDKVAVATLAPGQRRSLCPAVRLNYSTSSPGGQRDALLNHGGRAIDITTVVNQRSEGPATWASQPRTATSRYRINMPSPTTPSDAGVCRNTTALGDPDGVARSRGGFFWGWPDAGTNYKNQRPTPAMAGGWEVFRKSATGEAWSSFYTDPKDGGRRHRAGFRAARINDDGPPRGTTRQFKLRGYPFADSAGAPDKTRYVESSWIAQARGDDNWYCEDQLENPDAGPHNMP